MVLSMVRRLSRDIPREAYERLAKALETDIDTLINEYGCTICLFHSTLNCACVVKGE